VTQIQVNVQLFLIIFFLLIYFLLTFILLFLISHYFVAFLKSLFCTKLPTLQNKYIKEKHKMQLQTGFETKTAPMTVNGENEFNAHQ